MTSIRKIIILAFAAALAVVGVVYFVNRPKPPPPRQTVKSLHEPGILPKGYDGWLAHVEAELLAEGEERPEDPLYPSGIIRAPIIVDIVSNGPIFLNASEMSLPELIRIFNITFEGQSELDPIDFRIALDARISSVEPVAAAVVAAGLGDRIRPWLYGDEFARVYSIKLGGRFVRASFIESPPNPLESLPR